MGPPMEADVLVVGSGVAGLGAAVEAAAAGARTVVLEAGAGPGGASAISVGGACFVGTPLQDAAGVEDSVELAAADWRRAGGPTADMAWARRYLSDGRLAVHDWCEALGVRWVELRHFEGNTVPRWHLPAGGGPAVVAALLTRSGELGVELRTGVRVERVERADGGFSVLSEAGRWRARSLVVATGGFVADVESVRRHAPQLAAVDHLLCGGGPTALGQGHQILERLGASFVGLDRLWLYPVGTPSHRRPPPRGLVIRGVDDEIWLNARGWRFHDETRRGGASGSPALLAQPGATSWGIFDASTAAGLLLLDDPDVGTPLRTEAAEAERFWLHAPQAWRAPTLRELALMAGLPPDAVAASVARFNRAVEVGFDAEQGRPLRDARPITEAPFRAIRYSPIAQKNFGGVRTTLDCQVVGAPRGIFAAGELAGMAGGQINGRGALEGTMFGPCIFSGRIAGRSAAEAAARAN